MKGTPERLERQIRFIVEIDRIKQVFRQTWITDRSRKENDAEHSWHLAMMAVLLAEHADEPIDVTRVIKMVLVHDIVEIDAGDTFIYDEVGARDKAEREQKAADRIFALLPEDQRRHLRGLWEEFEARDTADARFAAALDRLQPLLNNFETQGGAWHEHGTPHGKVLAVNGRIAEGSRELWEYAKGLIDEAARRGYMPE